MHCPQCGPKGIIVWLHIPESFPCVADTAGSTLPSSECFQALERSATSSGKFHASAYWRRAWQKGRLTRLRFGMMLPPSILNRGLEQWISSLRDSPASPIPSQASEKASMMTAGRSGMTSSGSRGAVQLELFSLKTSPGCSPARGGKYRKSASRLGRRRVCASKSLYYRGF